MEHKEFKTLHNTTNKHIEYIAPQILTSWIEQNIPLDDNGETHLNSYSDSTLAPTFSAI